MRTPTITIIGTCESTSFDEVIQYVSRRAMKAVATLAAKVYRANAL